MITPFPIHCILPPPLDLLPMAATWLKFELIPMVSPGFTISPIPQQQEDFTEKAASDTGLEG